MSSTTSKLFVFLYFYQLPEIETTQSSIVTPKILDIDVKKARESYQRYV